MSNIIDEVLNLTPLYGEGAGATAKWLGGYAFGAGAKIVTSFLLVILTQWLGRRGDGKRYTGWKWVDLAIRGSLPLALYPLILYVLFSGLGNMFVFNNVFGPANLMSLHVDQSGALANPTEFHLSGGLPGYETSHGNNFFPWIFPMLFEYTGIIFLAVSLAGLARLEFQNMVLAGIGGFVIQCCVFLTQVNYVESHWGATITGGLLFSIAIPALILVMAEVRGFIMFGFMLTMPIYVGIWYLLTALGSFQLMNYSTDTIFIWETTVFPGLAIVIWFLMLVLGNYVKPALKKAPVGAPAASVNGGSRIHG